MKQSESTTIDIQRIRSNTDILKEKQDMMDKLKKKQKKDTKTVSIYQQIKAAGSRRYGAKSSNYVRYVELG